MRGAGPRALAAVDLLLGHQLLLVSLVQDEEAVEVCVCLLLVGVTHPAAAHRAASSQSPLPGHHARVSAVIVTRRRAGLRSLGPEFVSRGKSLQAVGELTRPRRETESHQRHLRCTGGTLPGTDWGLFYLVRSAGGGMWDCGGVGGEVITSSPPSGSPNYADECGCCEIQSAPAPR